MKTYTASITAHATAPSVDAPIVLGVEAPSPLVAARSIAARIAAAHYGADGIAPHVNATAKSNVFRAFIGAYERGVTKGVTLRIAIEEEIER